jgi:UDP:flavonoid glycosyltransferase YjiC (YdhE family)
LLPKILAALGELPVTVIAATAGRIELNEVPRNAFCAQYLPGAEAAQRAALVICNGGSPTTHQALAAGAPVFAIPSNMDQYLNMEACQRSGAASFLRPRLASTERIQAAVKHILEEQRFTESAKALQQAFSRHVAEEQFAHRVAEALGAVKT